MLARVGVVLVGLAFAAPAWAQDLTPEHARRFVVGKLFGFTCFDGTRGAGRIFNDGSVAGTVQMGGSGPAKYMVLPANTLRVNGEKVCASVKGVPFDPCFNLTRTSQQSFRGSISGLGFAYCNFTSRGRGRGDVIRTAKRNRNQPLALRSTVTAE
jgi:hypothetical protein